MTKGPLELRRTYPDVGVIRVSAGTHSKRTLRAVEMMCQQLYDAGRLDYLRLLRDRVVTPMGLYERLRGMDYRLLPPPMTERLAGAVERVLGLVEVSAQHRKNLKSHLGKIVRAASPEATADDVPGIVAGLRPGFKARGEGASFNRLRAAALTFLRETVGRRSPLHADVLDIRKLPEHPKREPMPLTPVEAFGLAVELGPDLGACWLTLCLTGMGRGEYAGRWTVEDGHLHIYGTKRAGRNRVIPLVMVPMPPITSARFLHERIREASGGRVQFYDARRTYTKWLEQAGVIPAHQDAYTGHGSRSMTDQYKRGNIRPYLDEDAGKLRAFLRNALENAGLDAGAFFGDAAASPLQPVGPSRVEGDAPSRTRTHNLLIRSQSRIGARKGKCPRDKKKASSHTARKEPKAADVMRGRVRGGHVQQPEADNASR